MGSYGLGRDVLSQAVLYPKGLRGLGSPEKPIKISLLLLDSWQFMLNKKAKAVPHSPRF